MPRGGYRPGSGPAKGSHYKPRVPKVPGDEPVKVKKTVKKTVEIVEPKAPAKKKACVPVDVVADAATANQTPLEFVLSVMRDKEIDVNRRDRMAALALPFCHPKAGEKGKKEEKSEKAKAASSGKFAPSRPPALKAVK
jgi:hypothetical protein